VHGAHKQDYASQAIAITVKYAVQRDAVRTASQPADCGDQADDDQGTRWSPAHRSGVSGDVASAVAGSKAPEPDAGPVRHSD
jgi:hypothetical protein